MLTYIEPCGWCSSSISSLKCPSNVDKSNEPYPDLSTLSRLSTNESLSLSRYSLQSNQKTAFSTSVIRSTYSHPHDYHSRKRIDELHERMDEIQIIDFLKFINYHLSLKKSSENLHINDFLADFSNGHILIDLIEILSSTKLKREHGRTRFHSLSNVQYVLDYLKLRLQHINITPQDIVSGNRKQILALLWIIMKVFDFRGFHLMNKNCFREKTLLTSGQDRSLLLNWLNHLLNQCLINETNLPQDFYLQTWINSYYLSSILKYLIPISEKYLTMKSFDYLKRINSIENFNQQRLEICLDLSNYCFHTTTVINYQDKTEISLIKYFSDLQKNIFQLLKSDQIGKLVQINPYIKQILQTIEHSSQKINVNEQYLVCIEDEEKENRKSDSDFVERSKEHLKQVNGIVEEFDEQIVINENVEHLVSKAIEEAIEQMTSKNEEPEQIVLLSSNEKEELSEQIVPIFNNHKSSVYSDEQEKEKYLSFILDEVSSIVPVEQTKNETIELPLSQKNIQQSVENDDHDQLQSETPQEQVVTSIHEDKQTLDQSEQIQTMKEEEQLSLTLKEDVEQIVPEVIEANLVLITSEEVATVPKEETLNEKIDQSTIETPSQFIIFSEEKEAETLDNIHNEISVISNEELEEPTTLPTESKPVSITIEKIEEKSEESIVPLIESKPVLASTDVIEEKLEEPTTTLIEPKPISTTAERTEGKLEQTTTTVIESKPVLAAADEIEEKLEGPSTILIESKPVSTADEKIKEKLEQSNVPLADSKPISTTTENYFVEKISKVSSNTFVNEPVEQPSTILTQKEHVSADKKVNPSTNKNTSHATTSGEKSTISSNKQLEKPIVKEVQQQSFTSYGQNNQSTHSNKKFVNPPKKSIPTASFIQDNSNSRHDELRLQPNTTVKQSEQRKNVNEIPVQSVVTTPMPCSKYSDAINQPVQSVARSKKQEQASVSKKKVASSLPSNETPKQSIIITEEIRQIPTEISTQKSEPSSVQQHQANVSTKSNEETKKSRNKNKKSRRSNAKKANAKNNSANIENSSESISNNGEEKEESEDNILDEPKSPPANDESVIEVHTTLANNANSSALRSRKSRKKKTVATVNTTIVEKTSSPALANRTAPNRNFFVVVKECIRDRKIIAFKCVIILVCLCLSIIILVFSHK